MYAHTYIQIHSLRIPGIISHQYRLSRSRSSSEQTDAFYICMYWYWIRLNYSLFIRTTFSDLVVFHLERDVWTIVLRLVLVAVAFSCSVSCILFCKLHTGFRGECTLDAGRLSSPETIFSRVKSSNRLHGTRPRFTIVPRFVHGASNVAQKVHWKASRECSLKSSRFCQLNVERVCVCVRFDDTGETIRSDVKSLVFV